MENKTDIMQHVLKNGANFLEIETENFRGIFLFARVNAGL
jgi:hypothetical protein